MAFSRAAESKAPGHGKREPNGSFRDRALPPDPGRCFNILLDGVFPNGPAAPQQVAPRPAAAKTPGQAKAYATAADLDNVPRQPRELRSILPRRGGGGVSDPIPVPVPVAPSEPPPLPEDAAGWDSRERDLWLQTDGTFHPRRMMGDDPRRTRSLPSRGSVSVIAATSEVQHDQHRLLWECFEGQEWDSKELIVVETYQSNPSEYFTKLQWSEKRLVYIGFHRPPGCDFSTGLKRNLGVHLAGGEFVAHFAVGDLYAPQYLDCMIGRLCQGKKGSRPVAATLSRWYTIDPWNGHLGFFCPTEWAKAQGLGEAEPAVRKHLFGDAFSLVYRREAALEQPFRECDVGAEMDFCTRIIDREGSQMVALLEDTRGVCLHTRRGGSAWQAYEVQLVSPEESEGLEAANCEVFDTYMRVVVEPEYREPEANPEEKRVHPEDGKAYTLKELQELCKVEQRFTTEEVEIYWRNQCKPLVAMPQQVPQPAPPKVKPQRPREVSVEVAPGKQDKEEEGTEKKSLLMRLESAWEEAKAEERAKGKIPFCFAETGAAASETTPAKEAARQEEALPAIEDLLERLDGEDACAPPPAMEPAPPAEETAEPAATAKLSASAADAGPASAEETAGVALPSMAVLLADLDGDEEDEVLDLRPAALSTANAAPSTVAPNTAAVPNAAEVGTAVAPASSGGELGVPDMAALLADLDGDEDDEVLDLPPTAPSAVAAVSGGEPDVPGMAELLAQLDSEEPTPAVPGMDELLAQLDGEAPGTPLGMGPEVAVPAMSELLAELDGEEPEPAAEAMPGMEELLARLDGEAMGEEVD